MPPSLPGAAARAVMADWLPIGWWRRLCRIGLDHYARPGDALARAAAERTLRRNFQGYVADGRPGSWASAPRPFPACRRVSPRIAPTGRLYGRYRAAVLRRRAASPDLTRIACAATSSTRDVPFRGRSRRDLPTSEAALKLLPRSTALSSLIATGYRRGTGALAVTERARPLVRSVCAAFDRYYTGAEGRHARGLN